MQPLISVVIPAFNEEKNLPVIAEAIAQVFSNINYSYEIIFIDDGSSDSTATVLKQLATGNNCIKYILFSRNFGHQMALKAGLDKALGNAVISMDCDMQHPPATIIDLINEWKNGFDVVYTIRKDAEQLGYFKKRTSKFFYTFLNSLSDIELESGTADFRLLSRNVVEVAKNFTEKDLFWRGLIKWMGFRQTAIHYHAANRQFGASKYTFKKMMRFALNGITSFSTKPLNIAIYLGFISSFLSLLYIPYAVFSYLNHNAVPGWISVIVTIAFFGGLQLMILGIIGLYLGKLFMQSKQRPHYIIKETNI